MTSKVGVCGGVAVSSPARVARFAAAALLASAGQRQPFCVFAPNNSLVIESLSHQDHSFTLIESKREPTTYHTTTTAKTELIYISLANTYTHHQYQKTTYNMDNVDNQNPHLKEDEAVTSGGGACEPDAPEPSKPESEQQYELASETPDIKQNDQAQDQDIQVKVETQEPTCQEEANSNLNAAKEIEQQAIEVVEEQQGVTEITDETDKHSEAQAKETLTVSEKLNKTSCTSETQEVSSTIKDYVPRRRRSSHQSSRGYPGSFQNYGLAYLPYKSNFEPSEDARRRADEFLKTLKL